MIAAPQLFKIDRKDKQSQAIKEAEFSHLGFQERRDIQEWVAANPSILGEDLLIIGKEFSEFDRTNERLDLLAVDSEGKLVIIELKRDDSGADAYWQAIKYASYFQKTSAEEIVDILASYEGSSNEEAEAQLHRHLNEDDLSSLNNDQRIILASHRFAPQVTSAALWLNGKTHNLITCVQLTPYQDGESMYVHANTIIPVPGAEDYMVQVGSRQDEDGVRSNNFAVRLQRTFDRNRNDSITPFLLNVGDRVRDALPQEVIPQKKSKWAGGNPYSRYYHLWYANSPWSNWGLSYRVNLFFDDQSSLNGSNVELADLSDELRVRFQEREVIGELSNKLKSLGIDSEPTLEETRVLLTHSAASLDDHLADRLSQTVKAFIETLTPIVNEFEEEDNEEEA